MTDETIERLTAERDAYKADVEAAAGELLVDVPPPGSDMARLLIANRLMSRRLEVAQRLLVAAEYFMEACQTMGIAMHGHDRDVADARERLEAE